MKNHKSKRFYCVVKWQLNTQTENELFAMPHFGENDEEKNLKERKEKKTATCHRIKNRKSKRSEIFTH